MPAQSGDPVAAALHRSLMTVKKCTRETEDLDSLLVATSKQVLLAEIKYEQASGYDLSILSNLKTKYIVLSANCPNGTVVKNEETRPKENNQVVVKKLSKDKDPVTLPVPKRVLYPPESVQLGWKSSTPVGSGFINLGNTCYLNSTLQALFHVPAFVNWLLNDTAHTSKCEMMNGMTHSECLICAMVKTLQCSQRCTGSAIKPLQIYSKLKSICKHLVHGHQEDAHEFLRYLIEGMERSYLNIFNGLKLDTYSKETTPLNQIFGGYIRTEVTCLECNHVSTTFQHFQDLLLDIRQVGSVDEALESYFGRERLGDGEQAYKCEQCHKRVAATKKFSLERPPKALCIQLKRFGAMGGKNSKHINLKQYLDISKYRHKAQEKTGQLEPLRYRLVAMVTHLGPSSSCGHYTAVGQSAVGSYYLFDDSVVRPLSVHNVLTTNAYIIMYEQETGQAQQQTQPDSPTKLVLSNGHVNGIEGKPIPNGSTSQTVEKIPAATSSSPPSSAPSPLPPERKPQLRFPEQKLREKFVSESSSRLSPSRSLVPYLSESSESESEASSLTSPERIGSPATSPSRRTNGSQRSPVKESPLSNPPPNSPRLNTLSHNGKGSTVSLVGSNQPDKSAPRVEVDTALHGWEVTPARIPAPSPTGSVGSSSGRWSITSSSERDKSSDKGQSVNKTGNSSSEKIWDGNRHNSTVGQLMKMSYRGYGNGNVNSWNGSRSELDRETENERVQEKRSRSGSYDDELDRGKVKKRKKYHPYKEERRNRFQEFQNHKNTWGGGSRQNFYRQYTYERSRGHHGYYRGNQHRWH